MTVLRVLQNGYELKGRTLRPAAVVVATTPKEPSENSSAAQ
jgi:molecular chaperone GrpE (heat shock protein)